jgi:hypothetical protein
MSPIFQSAGALMVNGASKLNLRDAALRDALTGVQH